MKAISLAAVLAFCALPIAGCGGGTSSPSSSTTASPYAGSYAGTFTATSETLGTQTGSGNVTVANDGTFSGNLTDSSPSQTGTISGTIASNGLVNLTLTYANQTIKLEGTLTGNNMNLTGALSEYTPSGTLLGTLAITLTQAQPDAKAN
jgi:hypothetical protein